jgi:multidrug efflux pump subunit AcrB
MRALIQFFTRYPAMVNLGLLLVLLLGLLSLSQVRYTLDPSEDPTEIYIDLTYRGASPLEIEDRAVSRIEENLRGTRGVDRVTSVSRENGGRITIELFEWMDINEAQVEVENAVQRISDFPAQMEDPVVYRQEMLNPTISLALTGGLPLAQKKDYARDIRDDLLLDGGLSNVNIHGLPEEEIVIQLDDARLDRYDLTMPEIATAIRRANVDITGGELRLDAANWQIRALHQENEAMGLANIVLRTSPDGETLRLADVATLREAFAEQPRQRYFNGQESVAIEVLTTNDENIVQTAAYVRDYMQSFNAQHEGVELHIIDDMSVFVKQRAASLWENGIAGLLLVLLILSLFLDKRIAFWVALTIPFALLGTLVIALFGYDLTINVVSIFGFILVLGMLVDTGVVVAENIYRHYSEFGKTPAVAARDGAAEVASPMIISLLTTTVAFSIFFFLPGKPGAFFTEVSFVVTASLLAALIITFLFLPAKLTASKVMSSQNKTTRVEQFLARQLTNFRDKLFMPFTRLVSYRWKWLNVSVFVLLMIAALAVIRTGIVPVTFFPYLDDDIQLLRIELPPGTPADTTHARLMELEEAVARVNQRLSERRSDGREVVTATERQLGPETHQARLRVVMLSGDARGMPANEVNNLFREELGPMPDARYVRFMSAMAEMRFGGLPVDISVSGEDLREIQQGATELKDALAQRDDLVDVASNSQAGSPELHLTLKPAGEQLGLTTSGLMEQVRAAYFGIEVQNVQRNRDDVRLWLRFSPEQRSSYAALADLQIRTPQGRYPLSEVARVEPVDALLEINHTEGRRSIRVDADLADPGMSAPAILQDISARILPPIQDKYPGLRFTIEGQNRESAQVTAAMQDVAPVLLVLMLALLVINFQSFSQTFLVLLSLPFAFIGVVLGHWLHGATVTIFSLIGMIALVGILINNMLVLITAFNDNIRAGQGFNDALYDAVRSRFRPILLTTLSTVAGLIPMIFTGGLASVFLKPPAISIAYGLMFGLLISLTLTPAFLVMSNVAGRTLRKLRGQPAEPPERLEPAYKLYHHQKQQQEES